MAVRWLAVVPLLFIFVGIAFANHATPIVLGMPFLFFYTVLCVILTSICIAIVYKFDPTNKKGE
ncbi:DUF3311 domain-containing protein [Alicyclobacillus cycloheptanicus]|uniref:Membrane protein n=1 Tax=Alicyclobacillus cycloheptanicus TaxID=1457 RepID=A0ABT9XMQ4_9BACL|nr:DUF3311 domain-containing protein [Alicyclobacillus cycloheptanicus]MDQ0191603.1 putative membrane protein [Alicyclobacillus cycloheptanicus]WDM02001.1 DUF3311 domain-containing protein [Alicyclobacillus cycloheptanicus]